MTILCAFEGRLTPPKRTPVRIRRTPLSSILSLSPGHPTSLIPPNCKRYRPMVTVPRPGGPDQCKNLNHLAPPFGRGEKYIEFPHYASADTFIVSSRPLLRFPMHLSAIEGALKYTRAYMYSSITKVYTYVYGLVCWLPHTDVSGLAFG